MSLFILTLKKAFRWNTTPGKTNIIAIPQPGVAFHRNPFSLKCLNKRRKFAKLKSIQRKPIFDVCLELTYTVYVTDY